MSRILITTWILVAALSATTDADTNVKLAGGRLSIQARSASISEVLERIREQTGMNVIFDGAPPLQLFGLRVEDETPLAAITRVLEGRGLNYALVPDESGTGVKTVFITTAPAPPRRPSSPPADAMPDAVELNAEEEPAMETEPGIGAAGSPDFRPAAPAATGSTPWMLPTPPPPPASPFTPQGPGPILLPPPGAAAATPPATPSGPPSAVLPPWEKAGYYGKGH